MAITPPVSTMWVTDRESNALVAFSADKLLSNPADSIIAGVNVGQRRFCRRAWLPAVRPDTA